MSEDMDKLLKAQHAADMKTVAQRMLEGGELALSKIAEYTGLSVSTVRRMAKKLEEAKAAQAAQV